MAPSCMQQTYFLFGNSFVVVVVDVDALASTHVKGSFVVAVKINSVMCNLVPG